MKNTALSLLLPVLSLGLTALTGCSSPRNSTQPPSAALTPESGRALNESPSKATPAGRSSAPAAMNPDLSQPAPEGRGQSAAKIKTPER